MVYSWTLPYKDDPQIDLRGQQREGSQLQHGQSKAEWVMAHPAKQPLPVPASHTSDGSRSRIPLLIQPAAHVPGKAMECGLETWGLPFMWETWMELPSSAWPSPGHCSHLRSEPTTGW